MSSFDENTDGKPARKRSLTSLTLQWLSEKMRKSEELKGRVQSGQYEVDSVKLAASLASDE